jgi:dolichol-phosphate mannosyltransferase
VLLTDQRGSMDTKTPGLNVGTSLSSESDRGTIELALVIPTFNERENVGLLLDRLEVALKGIRWEAIFVDDDSPDGTAAVVRELAQKSSKIRVIQRIGRRGLTSACVEGVLSSSTPFFAIIDADMQHDESILPEMLHRLKTEELDVVVGSRYTEGGSVPEWDKTRQIISQIATRVSRLVIKTDLRDPMSGFFLMRRAAFDKAVHRLSQQGFKILLDLFASTPHPLRFAEVPYQFGTRQHGESKLDGMAAWEYGMLLADKLFGQFIPARFLLFAIVGGLGLVVHMAALAAALSFALSFTAAQTIAVVVAMTFNFMLNNVITYRDRRLRGWSILRGLISFYAVCALGAVANVGAATFVYSWDNVWWLAGLAGALVGAVWNYSVSQFITWRRP